MTPSMSNEARGLLDHAEIFLPSARPTIHGCSSYFHHVAISAELGLKAYLVAGGASPAWLRDRHGHDLVRLLEQTRREGLAVQPRSLHTLAMMLGDPYRRHSLASLGSPFASELACLLARDVVADLHHDVRDSITDAR